MSSTIEDPISTHLKSLYKTYRDTTSIPAKGEFFSPSVMQICRPKPSYAATNRETIVQFLHDAVKAGTNLATAGLSEGELPENARDFKRCTIRPVRMGDDDDNEEFEFGNDEFTLPLGYKTEELKRKAVREGWRGMRVDLWFDQGMGVDLLVKVRYWWRKEKNGRPVEMETEREQQQGQGQGQGQEEVKHDDEWVQILHDILYMGPRDGTEGRDGELL